jgi:hypothetical protein
MSEAIAEPDRDYSFSLSPPALALHSNRPFQLTNTFAFSDGLDVLTPEVSGSVYGVCLE